MAELLEGASHGLDEAGDLGGACFSRRLPAEFAESLAGDGAD